MKRESRLHGMQSVLVIALCGIFAFLALGSTLMGSGVYRSGVQQGERNSTRRTALSYLINQVRQGDDGNLGVTAFGDGDALVLTSAVDGTLYDTVLYCSGGFLRELYCERGLGLAPQDGAALIDIDGLDIALEGGLITFTAQQGEERFSISAAPRAGAVLWDSTYDEVLQ